MPVVLVHQGPTVTHERYEEAVRRLAVKPAVVVCDGYRVIIMLGQALSAGMVGWLVTSSSAWASSTGWMRQRASTSRPR